MQTYLNDSARTASGGAFHTEIVPLDLLLNAIRKRLDTNANVDGCKKSLFYGRDLSDRLEDLKQQSFDGDGFAYTVDPDYVHAILGIDTEAAELQEQLFTALVYGTEINRAKLIDEAGDLLWYLAHLFRKLGVTFEEVADLNLEKLRRRFPVKFEAELALNRDMRREDEVFH